MLDIKPVIPPQLAKGDTVALLSPASAVYPEFVEGASRRLKSLGLNVREYPSARGTYGSYSAPLQQRLADMTEAIVDPEIRAIFCTRGGYGCIHLLPHLFPELLQFDPKWLIGFSDISALHAFWAKSGVMSIHASMARHLTSAFSDDPSFKSLLDILFHHRINPIETPPVYIYRPGSATGRLIGGNLAVLNSLAGTPFDLLAMPDDVPAILFIEDVSEAIYAVERMLFRLSLTGTLRKVKGIIFGEFTEYKSDKNFATMEQMLANRILPLLPKGVPAVTHFPIGHIDVNMPLIESHEYTLTVTAEGSGLTPA